MLSLVKFYRLSGFHFESIEEKVLQFFEKHKISFYDTGNSCNQFNFHVVVDFASLAKISENMKEILNENFCYKKIKNLNFQESINIKQNSRFNPNKVSQKNSSDPKNLTNFKFNFNQNSKFIQTRNNIFRRSPQFPQNRFLRIAPVSNSVLVPNLPRNFWRRWKIGQVTFFGFLSARWFFSDQ